MNIATIEISLLQLFLLLFETRNVTKAGEKQGLSQPSASRMLAKLRDLFCDELFVRTAQGLVPTPRAEDLAPRVKAVLVEMEALIRPEVFQPQTFDKVIRIASTDYGALTVLTHVAPRFYREAPQGKMEVVTFQEDFFNQLEKGGIDIALYADDPMPPDFHALDLFEDNHACLVRKEHPLACYESSEKIPLHEFELFPRILVTIRGGRLGYVDDEMARVGHPASKTSMWMPYFLGAPLFLRGTDLVMVLPRRAGVLLQDYYNLKLLSTPILLENFTYRLIWHERVNSDPAMRWFRNLIAEEIRAHS